MIPENAAIPGEAWLATKQSAPDSLPSRPEPERPPVEGEETSEAADSVQFSSVTVQTMFVVRYRSSVERLLPESRQRPERDDHAARLRPEKLVRRLAHDLRRALHGLAEAEGGPRQARRLLHRAGKALEHDVRDLQRHLRRMARSGGEAENALSEIHGRVRQALDALARETERAQDAAPEALAEASRETGMQDTRSYALEIRTQEGDVVTLQLDRVLSAHRSTQFESGPDGETVRSRFEAADESTLTYSVAGELNEAEQNAIGDLVRRADGLAKMFFKGNVQAALRHSANTGFDDETLAGYSLNLTRSVQTYASAAYRTTSEPTIDDPAGEAVDLVHGLRELPLASGASRQFPHADDLAREMFRGAVETDPRIETEDRRLDLRALLDALLGGPSPA